MLKSQLELNLKRSVLYLPPRKNADIVDSPYTYHLMVGASQLTQKRVWNWRQKMSQPSSTLSVTVCSFCVVYKGFLIFQAWPPASTLSGFIVTLVR